ncbi:hypothetical protein GCM10023310_36920 [Paenibacillus vulneris]|uniref:Transposase n=1 Tax=Paenibacillus vulneris TaxID=1133364 RepID=A0ABW3USV3_9BACL
MTYGTSIWTPHENRKRRGLSARSIAKLIAFFLAILIRQVIA